MSKAFLATGPIFLLPLLIFQPKQTTVICESKNADYAVPAIRREVERAFQNAVVYVVHGNEVDQPGWRTVPDNDRAKSVLMQEKVEELEAKYPNRPIVIWSCNKNRTTIKGRNVWYFLGPVWKIPTSQLSYNYRDDDGIPVAVRHYGEVASASLCEMIRAEK